jgi:16S rRNA (guanine527-N7)-methyltransferase
LEEEAAAIGAAASAVGVRLEPQAARAMAVHARLVRGAGMNLTSILEPAAMHVLHVADSLAPLAVWPEVVRAEGTALDLGAGAGYPGLPLALAGAARAVTLLEATRKKAEFLAEAARLCGAPARAVWERAERAVGAVGPQARVWVRAVGPLPVVVELAFGLLSPGGVLVAWKGPGAEGEEAAAGEAACRALGGTYLGKRVYALPGGAGERALYAYRRGEGPLPPGVPRSPAAIRRRPLGRR